MRNLKYFLFIISLVFLDQITKFYFFGKNVKIFEFFSFNFVANTGTVFGFFKNSNSIFIFISLVVICFLLFYFTKEKNLRLEFSLVLAGAFGNLADRIFRGYVIDFIDFRFWYVFNLADAFITIGVILLFYKSLKGKV